jgi:hypothetical protein
MVEPAALTDRCARRKARVGLLLRRSRLRRRVGPPSRYGVGALALAPTTAPIGADLGWRSRAPAPRTTHGPPTIVRSA